MLSQSLGALSCRRRRHVSRYTEFNLGLPIHRHRGTGRRRQVAARRSARLASRRDGRPRRNRESVPRGLLRGPSGRRLPGAALLHLSRHRQQTALRQSDLFSQLTICDYLFDRDKIYAYLNLDDNELFIYQRLYELLAQDVPSPDLVIFLQTPTDVLRRRLRERERANPDLPSLDDDYVRELNEAYNHFFFHYTATPLLVVETSQFDLSWGEDALGDLERSAQDRWAAMARRYYGAPNRNPSNGRTIVAAIRDRQSYKSAIPDRRSALLYAPLMAWFKKVRKPIEALARQEPRAGRALGQMPFLRPGHLQQGSRRQPERLHRSARHHFRPERLRAPADAVRRRVGGTRLRPARRPIRCSSPTRNRIGNASRRASRHRA